MNIYRSARAKRVFIMLFIVIAVETPAAYAENSDPPGYYNSVPKMRKFLAKSSQDY